MNNVTKVDIWSAPVDDNPGGLLGTIEDLVLKASLDLEFLHAERRLDQPGKGVVYLLPICGERQQAIAERLGMVRNDHAFCLRVTGNNEPGLAYRYLKALARRGLNLRSVSAAVVREEFVMYVALDTPEDAEVARKILLSPV